MSSPRLWILVLVAMTLLTGGVAGYLLGAAGRSADDDRLMADYADRLAARFDLDETRRRDLRFVLERYEKDLYDLEARYLRERMEDELVELGERTTERIRRYVIPVDRLEEFDALCRGLAVPSAATLGQPEDRS